MGNASIRYILTDVLPAELPLIFSNYKFYEFLNKNSSYIDKAEKYKNIKKDGTIPVNFKIRKGKSEYRKMSLMHPYMQMVLTKFINDYADIILLYFEQNMVFSVRTPVRVNNTEYVIPDKDIDEIKKMLDTSEEEYNYKEMPIVTHFFDLSRFAKITDFYKSYYLKDLEIKYSYMMKMDILNCFNNIYTHSVDWAYLGSKEIAKANINNSERFSYIIDELMQYMNYRETNGILIGPEFSRLFAEIILTRIDNLIYSDLKKMGINYKKEYEIARFLDDIFIFSSSKDTLEKIAEIVREKYLDYKLTINDQKMYLEKVPFLREHVWVHKIKLLLNTFSVFFENINVSKGRTAYDNLLEGVRELVVAYEPHMGHIISYVITGLENILNQFYNGFIGMEIKDVHYHSCKYIDLIAQLASLSISHDNIIKASRIFIKFIHIFKNDKRYSCNELIYKKAFMLLNYHKDCWTEMQNLVLVLSLVKNKNLPQNFLLDIIEKDNGYLSLSVVAFYILRNDNKKVYYEDVYNKINKIYGKILEDCADIYGFEYKGNKMPDEKNIDKFIESDRLYIVHDFYSSGVLDSENLKNTEKIRKFIRKRSEGLGDGKIYTTFIMYIKDFDKPFIKWDISDNEMIKDFLLQKQYKKISY